MPERIYLVRPTDHVVYDFLVNDRVFLLWEYQRMAEVRQHASMVLDDVFKCIVWNLRRALSVVTPSLEMKSSCVRECEESAEHEWQRELAKVEGATASHQQLFPRQWTSLFVEDSFLEAFMPRVKAASDFVVVDVTESDGSSLTTSSHRNQDCAAIEMCPSSVSMLPEAGSCVMECEESAEHEWQRELAKVEGATASHQQLFPRQWTSLFVEDSFLEAFMPRVKAASDFVVVDVTESDGSSLTTSSHRNQDCAAIEMCPSSVSMLPEAGSCVMECEESAEHEWQRELAKVEGATASHQQLFPRQWTSLFVEDSFLEAFMPRVKAASDFVVVDVTESDGSSLTTSSHRNQDCAAIEMCPSSVSMLPEAGSCVRECEESAEHEWQRELAKVEGATASHQQLFPRQWTSLFVEDSFLEAFMPRVKAASDFVVVDVTESDGSSLTTSSHRNQDCAAIEMCPSSVSMLPEAGSCVMECEESAEHEWQRELAKVEGATASHQQLFPRQLKSLFGVERFVKVLGAVDADDSEGL
ncbi:acylphosphatase family protein [Babesia caballi]|uniref:Acylphosphatase family protein n=1 Tax=Babesia caballi TaxID=5871 RepID=A0AAV4LTZ7_BABCB|nr:acylphosphatase family protein [Babesia caballi]